MLLERELQTLTRRGLDHSLPPMRLWHKAKKLGVWDPRDIDFRRDIDDWRRLEPLEREVLLNLSSLFLGGEESVTLDLLPLIQTIAAEGRLEEEIYLTSFLFEEAKHVEAFRRFLDEVAGADGLGAGDLRRFLSPSYERIFCDELPRALGRLGTDRSPVAQAEASATYNMIVEGVLAETGYHAYHATLARNRILPGMQQVVAYLKRDESRHLAYGVFLLSRLVAEHGEPVAGAIERRMAELLEPALGTITEMFARYEVLPFGLAVDEFLGFATSQFEKRMTRIRAARGRTVADVCGDRLADEEDAGPGDGRAS